MRHHQKCVVSEEEWDIVIHSSYCCLLFTMRLWSGKSAMNVHGKEKVVDGEIEL